MTDVSERHRKTQINKANKMVKLLENEDFQELIINDFINNGSINNVIEQNLDNSKTIDELKARQILHKYLFAIITTGEILSSH